MKIAQIAPLVESVPPVRYGGTERVVSALTEELVNRGHEVTLFASGDSITKARLEAVVQRSLRSRGLYEDKVRTASNLLHIGNAYDQADKFDIVHDHCGVLSMPAAQSCKVPVIMTVHGCFFDFNIKVYQGLKRPKIVTISHDQAASVAGINHFGTVHNGLPMENYPFCKEREKFLLYVGRITPIKGPAEAVKIAAAMKMNLVMAAKLEENDQEYFEREIKPSLGNGVVWLGEIGEEERNELMSRAWCLIHPASWREPFGLTLIEALACGCPVVALSRGSIPEIIENEKTGFVVDKIEDFPEAIGAVGRIDGQYCRKQSLSRFSAQRMVNEYENLYKMMLVTKNS